MTKAQHTSGPWQLPTGFESVHPCEHEGLPVFADNDPFDTIAMVMPREDGNANATLIAAAPDLLEALESLEDAGYLDDIYIATAEKCRAAIAKAKGV